MSGNDDTRSTESRANDTTDLRGGGKRPVLEHGKQIGRYRLLGVLGRGGMGVVYRAHDPELARELAIKVLHRGLRDHRDRLQREAQAIARLKHPNVVTVYDVGVDGDELFIAMELVEHGTLRAWASGRRWREIVAMFAAAGRGLAAAHEAEIVHRDFKPDNVLVTRDGRAVVSDFGIAEIAGDAGGIGSGSGTPAYMSPEQLEAAAVDSRSDQFSFCVAMWETLYGERPFAYGRGSSLEEILATIAGGRLREVSDRRGVPTRIHAALTRGLSHAPSDRFPSMNALLAELAPRRRPWLAIAALAVAAIAAAVAVFAVTRADRPLVAGEAIAGCDAGASAVWDDAARARYLGDGGDAEAGVEARWFDAYASGADLVRRTVCTAARARRDAGAGAVIACLDGVVDDLRTAIARPDRTRWPMLRPLASCVAPATATSERSIGAVGIDERLFVSRDARTLAISRTDGAWLRSADGGEPRRVAAMFRPIRWIADGTLVGDDGAGHLIAIDPSDGHVVRTIATDVPAVAVHDVSPDLSHVLLGDHGVTRLAPIAGAPAIAIGGDLGLAEARFSPGGTRVGILVGAGAGAALQIRDVASGAAVAIPLRLAASANDAMTWLDDDHVLIGGSLDPLRAPSGLWRLHVGPGGLVDPPEQVAAAAADTQLSAYDAADGQVLLERETMSRRMRLVGIAGDTSTHAAPGAIADFVPYTTDPATRRVLIAASGEPPRWLVLHLDDWSTRPVPAPSGLVVRDAYWRDGKVAALALGPDGWHYLESDEDAVTRDVALAGTAGLDRQHVGMRCSATMCVLRWHNATGLSEMHVDAAGARSAPSSFPPGKCDDWTFLPDGRPALILTSDHHTISIVGGAQPASVPSDLCHWATAFVAADATAVTVQCADPDGTSSLVRVPLDGTPASVLASSPDIYLGAALVDPTHVLVTSIVEAATVSLLAVR